MKFAYHSYAFGGRSWLPAWTLEEALRLTAECGFDGIELAAWRPHAFPGDLTIDRRKEMAALAGQFGLEYSAVCMVQVNHNLASPVEAERGASLAYTRACIDLADDLACPRVVIGGGWSIQPFTRQDAWNWAREGLEKAAGYALSKGICLVLENINRQRADVIVSTDDLIQMTAEIDSPALCPMLDFYHLVLEGENPIEAIQRVKHNLAYTHFLDARLSNRSRQVPGKGEVALPAILSTLQEVGYQGWLCAEIWGDDPVAIGRQTMQYFQSVYG